MDAGGGVVGGVALGACLFVRDEAGGGDRLVSVFACGVEVDLVGCLGDRQKGPREWNTQPP